MGKLKVDKERVKQAITAANAMKTGVCEVLGISRPTLDKYLKADKELQEFFEFTQHKQIDRAEYKLFEAVEKGESWAVMAALKSKRGRERGYGDAVDVTSGGKAIPDVIGVRLIDYRTDITDPETGSGGNSKTPRQDEDTGDGSKVG